MSRALATAVTCDPAPLHAPAEESDAAGAIGAVLSVPDARLDYAEAKLAFDRLVDPAIDAKATLAELDRWAAAARELAGADPNDEAKLAALRTLIYESGAWNEYRPFEYDHSNVRGQNVRVKLISHYLATRKGDCVSMPVLFLILAEKLGLDMDMAEAPTHIFLRYPHPSGSVVNLEPTSGALPARDEWIRRVRPMSDRAIRSGLYMRTVSRREGVALMAATVLQHRMDTRRYEDAIAIADAILAHKPRCGLTLANKGQASSTSSGRSSWRNTAHPFSSHYPCAPDIWRCSRRTTPLSRRRERSGGSLWNEHELERSLTVNALSFSTQGGSETASRLSRRSRASRSSPARVYGRHRESMNLASYVAADPINFVDPLGLEQEIVVTACGGGPRINGHCASEFELRQLLSGGGGSGGGGPSGAAGAAGRVLSEIGDALDKFAEKHLKPPEGRRSDEDQQKCMARIAGDTPALGVAGIANIAAGGAFLGYPRTPLAGGGGGTSLISSAARGAFGGAKMAGGVLGTGSIGGAIGRVLSRASVYTGAAAVGWAAGKVLGALKKCQ